MHDGVGGENDVGSLTLIGGKQRMLPFQYAKPTIVPIVEEIIVQRLVGCLSLHKGLTRLDI